MHWTERLVEIVLGVTAQVLPASLNLQAATTVEVAQAEADPNIEIVKVAPGTPGTRVAVYKDKAEAARTQIVELLNEHLQELQLPQGPSYMQIGAVLDSQGWALLLFAVGRVLGFWDILTIDKLGGTEDEAIQAAGQGWITLTGFDPTGKAEMLLELTATG